MPFTDEARHAGLSYRPDIDGLRAVAVVPVVLYHFGVPGFGGGYVGVDVFFVISGFLITGLIFGAMQAGRFSLAEFYERRARRILPALFAMIAAAFIAALLLFFPRDLVRFGESAAAAALFGSNIDFWLQAGYFDAGAEVKPLLHTWSLAVEEQFYLLFPALLWLAGRRRAVLLACVGVLAAASFALSLWGVGHAPSAAFYLLPFRTWELMLGAALALKAMPAPRTAWQSDLLVVGGLALIGVAVFGYDSTTRFPGAAAILPCFGAALVIHAGGEGRIARLLAARAVVFVGLISYSLYLWHWPVRVFAGYVWPGASQPFAKAALIAFSLVLALLSWRFVERPFRARPLGIARGRLFAGAGAAMLACLVLAGGLALAKGLPQRFSPEVRRIVAEAGDIEPLRHRCFNITPKRVEQGRACIIGAAGARPSFLLWGDSHADAVLPAVEAAAKKAGRAGLFIGHGRCPPLLGVTLADESDDLCAHLNDDTLRIAQQDGIATVILAARWAYYDRGIGFGIDANEHPRLVDREGGDNHAIFVRALDRTVAALKGRQVVLVMPVPEAWVSVPEALARAALYGQTPTVASSAADYAARQGPARAALAGQGARLVDPASLLCGPVSCRVEADGRPLYFDNHHLSVFGALRLEPLFAARFVGD